MTYVNYLEEIRQDILKYYDSLDESEKNIFNMCMIRKSDGVDHDELTSYEEFDDVYEMIDDILNDRSRKISMSAIYMILPYLLGYKKIQWLQGHEPSELLPHFKQIQKFINKKTVITKIFHDEYIIYDKTYEPAALKLIEIVNDSNIINRNQAAIGLLLGYTPEKVFKWICSNYDNKSRVKFYKELCDGSRMVDLLDYYNILFNNKPITFGILTDIDLPTVIKFKYVLDTELQKRYIKNKKKNS